MLDPYLEGKLGSLRTSDNTRRRSKRIHFQRGDFSEGGLGTGRTLLRCSRKCDKWECHQMRFPTTPRSRRVKRVVSGKRLDQRYTVRSGMYGVVRLEPSKCRCRRREKTARRRSSILCLQPRSVVGQIAGELCRRFPGNNHSAGSEYCSVSGSWRKRPHRTLFALSNLMTVCALDRGDE